MKKTVKIEAKKVRTGYFFQGKEIVSRHLSASMDSIWFYLSDGTKFRKLGGTLMEVVKTF
jgi:hypothetical protein